MRLVSSVKDIIDSDLEWYWLAFWLLVLVEDIILLPEKIDTLSGQRIMTALLDPGDEDLQYSALKFLLQHTDPLAQNSINQNRQACKTELSD